MLSACGISIDRQLTQVDGRVLEAPKVHIDYLRLMLRLMRGSHYLCSLAYHHAQIMFFFSQFIVEGW